MADSRGWRRLARNPAAIAAAFFLVLIAAAAFTGPQLIPSAHREPGPLQFSRPTLRHPFGTDLNGRDLLYRVLTGTQLSLIVGLSGALISLVIGTAYGLVSGYAGGRVDAAMMRVVDILYSIPRLVFILALINSFNMHVQEMASKAGIQWLVDYSRIAILIVSLGIIEWLTMARIVRGQVLALKTRQFVTAAQALGQSHLLILIRHLLPNLGGIIIVYLTLTIPAVVIDESFLSFLGLGIQAPRASLGSLLADGASAINPLESHWWLLVFPAATMAGTLLAMNLLGDALRDAFDVKGK